MQTNKFRVKTGDLVIVTTGKDRNKTGKLIKVDARKNGVTVEGVNVVKRHMRAKGNQQGGIVEKEAPIHRSNVMLYCGKCQKAVRCKIATLDDGQKSRICVKCGESFDK
jgi:large subunit ribosomal protein L24